MLSYDAVHLLHLIISAVSKFGFQSSVSVLNLSANQREKLLNFPLLTKETLEQQVKSICSTSNTMAGPGSCSKQIQNRINHSVVYNRTCQLRSQGLPSIRSLEGRTWKRGWKRGWNPRFRCPQFSLL